MAVVESLAGRWLRRYKLFFLIGLVILVLQIFLAYKSFKLPLFGSVDDTSHSGRNKQPNPNVLLNKKIKESLGSVLDDEDIHSNSNIYSKHKTVKDVTGRDTTNKKGSNKSALRLNELNFVPSCNIKAKEAISAIHRAKTQECKKQIADTACAIQTGIMYAKSLPNYCPHGKYIPNRALGCYKDEKNYRILSGYYTNFKGSNSPTKCIQMCLQSGFLYAGVQYSTECFCGNDEPPVDAKLSDPNCNMKCPGDAKEACGGYFTINIYETGISKFAPQVAETTTKSDEQPIRVAYLLTLNGRAVRQVHRLLKSLYNSHHYFYIHVDSRQDYMFRELLKLEKKYENIKLARKRFSTIWGGASLLQMLLASMNDLLNSAWNWDFVINLSESDFPVKTTDKLIEFLTANRGKNFVKSHGREVQRFIQKQGLDKTFVECDTHMWRIGDRELPHGTQVDGGSDWVALSREFVAYVTEDEQKDDLLKGLMVIFQHTLLPAESYFHTVLRNSRFCETYIDNNLHVTNWKRRLGCKCQYKHVVDWCGCSPNDFKPDDWPRLLATEPKQLFFGRKFEPIINQAVILQLEEWLYGPYPADTPNLNSYWQSVYHYKDKSPRPDDALLTVVASLARINAKSNAVTYFEPKKVLEVTNFIELDDYKGFLVLHEAIDVTRDGDGETEEIQIEFWAQPTQMTQTNKNSKVGKRIKAMEVSSEFDQKEQVARNFMKTLGPYSDPVLVFRLGGVQSVNQTSYNLTVLWIDPTGNVAEISDTHIEDGNAASINFVKSNLKQPIIPGIWAVKIVQRKSLIALCKFLVTPLQFHGHEEITQKNALVANFGTRSDILHNNSEWVNYSLTSDEREKLEEKSLANSKRIGLDLMQWIDSLVGNFYIIRNMCIVKTNDLNKFKDIVHCPEAMWSSFAPDPKSDISFELEQS